MRLALALILALVLATAIAVVDSHASEVQPAAAAILVCSAGFTFWLPRQAWLWVLVFGCSITAVALFHQAVGIVPDSPVEPNAWGGLVALLPATIGAGIGLAAQFFRRKRTDE